MVAKSRFVLLALVVRACAALVSRGHGHDLIHDRGAYHDRDQMIFDAAPYNVTFDVALNGGSQEKARFTVTVRPTWAPRGAAQFKYLVQQGWYNNAGVFRVVPGFVAQFGLPATPQDDLQNIMDDPVMTSNKRGTLVFATSGPNTRTSQLFINYGDNTFLNKQGFAPFGEVIGDGMAVVDRFFKGYGETPDQRMINRQGNSYLDARFPKMTKFEKVAVQVGAAE